MYNLPAASTRELDAEVHARLRSYFSRFGRVGTIRVMAPKPTRRYPDAPPVPARAAYVLLESKEALETALSTRLEVSALLGPMLRAPAAQHIHQLPIKVARARHDLEEAPRDEPPAPLPLRERDAPRPHPHPHPRPAYHHSHHNHALQPPPLSPSPSQYHPPSRTSASPHAIRAPSHQAPNRQQHQQQLREEEEAAAAAAAAAAAKQEKEAKAEALRRAAEEASAARAQKVDEARLAKKEEERRRREEEQKAHRERIETLAAINEKKMELLRRKLALAQKVEDRKRARETGVSAAEEEEDNNNNDDDDDDAKKKRVKM